MFSPFKKKTEKEKLQDRYRELTQGAHRLSHIYHKESDNKLFEAQRIMDQIKRMD